ncbi:MAG TPA: cytidine deaminase [Bacteroidales bacterium]
MKEMILTAKIEVYQLDELSEENKILLDAAKKASASAYAPYSHFQVGCAVRLKSGSVITGNNQENAAYTAGLCAERVAINHAMAWFPDDPIECIAIIAQIGGIWVKEVCTPCGECRQVMKEVELRIQHPITMLLASATEVYKITGIETLLPFGFNASTLSL